MIFFGIDLSGPSNADDTVVTAFDQSTDGDLVLRDYVSGADDKDILSFLKQLQPEGDMVVGIDAPLSYNIGGGDRPADAELRKVVTSAGLKAGSVMVPTMTRMAYLTLRGMSIARLLLWISEKIQIVEIHPGAVMALGGAPRNEVIRFKYDQEDRRNLLQWLTRQGMKNIDTMENPSDHYLAACACAFGAWKWYYKHSAWIYPAQQPFHPFDCAC